MKQTKYNYLSEEIPLALVASLQTAQGFDEKTFLAVHRSGEQLVSIRRNPAKFNATMHEEMHAKLTDGKVPWSTDGYYLRSRPLFTLDPLFHAGVYYVQEASSMFLEHVLKETCTLEQPLRVLDLCAAPGGKSTLIQSAISADSLLVSNEIIKSRANILVENITKWGAANVVVTNNDAKDFQRLPEFFDVIVVDAPCSGSGLFRKDPAAIDEWSLQNVKLCADRQQRILSEVMSALKPGGTLIYSTCSFSLEEDEQICDWLLTNHPVETLRVALEPTWGIVETFSTSNAAYGYRFYPDKVKGEGFFLAAFRKAGETGNTREFKAKQKPAVLSAKELETVHRHIQNAGNSAFIKWNDSILMMPVTINSSFLQLQAALYLKKAGVKLGSIIRDELIPDHEFALSSLMSDMLQSIELGEAEALDYLRRKDIKINTDARGWAVVKYKNVSLGLVKILANRVNNYYPREWRILNL